MQSKLKLRIKRTDTEIKSLDPALKEVFSKDLHRYVFFYFDLNIIYQFEYSRLPLGPFFSKITAHLFLFHAIENTANHNIEKPLYIRR